MSFEQTYRIDPAFIATMRPDIIDGNTVRYTIKHNPFTTNSGHVWSTDIPNLQIISDVRTGLAHIEGFDDENIDDPTQGIIAITPHNLPHYADIEDEAWRVTFMLLADEIADDLKDEVGAAIVNRDVNAFATALTTRTWVPDIEVLDNNSPHNKTRDTVLLVHRNPRRRAPLEEINTDNAEMTLSFTTDPHNPDNVLITRSQKDGEYTTTYSSYPTITVDTTNPDNVAKAATMLTYAVAQFICFRLYNGVYPGE